MSKIELIPFESDPSPTFGTGKIVSRMRYADYKRGGMSARNLRKLAFNYDIEPDMAAQTEATEVSFDNYFGSLESFKLANPNRRPIGAYVANELVGVSMSSDLTDQIDPFLGHGERREIDRLEQPQPSEQPALFIDTLLAASDFEISKEEVAEALLKEALEYANRRQVLISQFANFAGPLTMFLVSNGFDRFGRIGRPIGNAKQVLFVRPAVDGTQSHDETTDIQ